MLKQLVKTFQELFKDKMAWLLSSNNLHMKNFQKKWENEIFDVCVKRVLKIIWKRQQSWVCHGLQNWTVTNYKKYMLFLKIGFWCVCLYEIFRLWFRFICSSFCKSYRERLNITNSWPPLKHSKSKTVHPSLLFYSLVILLYHC